MKTIAQKLGFGCLIIASIPLAAIMQPFGNAIGMHSDLILFIQIPFLLIQVLFCYISWKYNEEF